MNDEIFSVILDDDEKIEKIYKPNKFMLYFNSFFATGVIALFFLVMAIFGVFAMSSDTNTPLWKAFLIIFGIYLSLLLLVILIQYFLIKIYYKNLFYAYSNKRIIIRSGIFGVDFKSLDLKMIGVNVVNVSLFDKIMRKNTGTIKFGSMANPMSQTNTINFSFANIENPYETYKEIKAYMVKVLPETKKEK